jgi:lysozyme
MDTRFLICAAIAVWLIIRANREPGDELPYQNEDLIDSAQTTLDEAMNTISETISGPGPIAGMRTSPDMIAMLRAKESLSLRRYALGDGGYTWGFGHFDKNPDALPEVITRDQAERIFADDVVNRAEKWVKLYVKVDLTQNQFDALVSIAFNMSPQSFKKFADAVNNGEGIDAIAQRSIGWVADKFKNGIANRRYAEVRVFNEGVYA